MKRHAYPDLKDLPDDEAEAYVRQAEAGIPLTREQLERLGLCPAFAGRMVLLPNDASLMTVAQLREIFPVGGKLKVEVDS